MAISCLNLDVSIEILRGGGKYCSNGDSRQDFDNFYPLPTRRPSHPSSAKPKTTFVGSSILTVLTREDSSDRKVHQWNSNEFEWIPSSLCWCKFNRLSEFNCVDNNWPPPPSQFTTKYSKLEIFQSKELPFELSKSDDCNLNSIASDRPPLWYSS